MILWNDSLCACRGQRRRPEMLNQLPKRTGDRGLTATRPCHNDGSPAAVQQPCKVAYGTRRWIHSLGVLGRNGAPSRRADRLVGRQVQMDRAGWTGRGFFPCPGNESRRPAPCYGGAVLRNSLKNKSLIDTLSQSDPLAGAGCPAGKHDERQSIKVGMTHPSNDTRRRGAERNDADAGFPPSGRPSVAAMMAAAPAYWAATNWT